MPGRQQVSAGTANFFASRFVPAKWTKTKDGKTVDVVGFECVLMIPVREKDEDGEWVDKIGDDGLVVTKKCGHRYVGEKRRYQKMKGHFAKEHPSDLNQLIQSNGGAETDSDDEEPSASATRMSVQPPIRQSFVKVEKKGDDFNTNFLSTIASQGLSFRFAHNKRYHRVFKHAVPPPRCVGKLMRELADRRWKELSAFFAFPAMAVDVGTVRKRYVAVVLVEKGRSMLVDLVWDGDFLDKRMSTDNIGSALVETLEALHEIGIRPVGIVADNANNMQALSKVRVL